MIRRLSPEAQQFAEWAYAKLGLPDPPNSESGRREVAAIGGVWVFAEAHLPASGLEDYRVPGPPAGGATPGRQEPVRQPRPQVDERCQVRGAKPREESPSNVPLARHYIGRTGSFFALPHLEIDCLALVE